MIDDGTYSIVFLPIQRNAPFDPMVLFDVCFDVIGKIIRAN
jgi:hypothetical protein